MLHAIPCTYMDELDNIAVKFYLVFFHTKMSFLFIAFCEFEPDLKCVSFGISDVEQT